MDKKSQATLIGNFFVLVLIAIILFFGVTEILIPILGQFNANNPLSTKITVGLIVPMIFVVFFVVFVKTVLRGEAG